MVQGWRNLSELQDARSTFTSLTIGLPRAPASAESMLNSSYILHQLGQALTCAGREQEAKSPGRAAVASSLGRVVQDQEHDVNAAVQGRLWTPLSQPASSTKPSFSSPTSCTASPTRLALRRLLADCYDKQGQTERRCRTAPPKRPGTLSMASLAPFFRWAVAAGVACTIAVALFLSWRLNQAAPPPSGPGKGPPTAALPGQPWFVDVTAASGINFRHYDPATPMHYIQETLGSGLGWIDYNNDGWIDLFVVQDAPFSLAPLPILPDQ